MGSEYLGPPRDPEEQSFPEKTSSVAPRRSDASIPTNSNPVANQGNEETYRLHPAHPSFSLPSGQEPTIKRKDADIPFEEPSYREHVTGSLAVPPSEAPNFQRAYWPYPQPPSQQIAPEQKRGLYPAQQPPQQPPFGQPGVPYLGQQSPQQLPSGQAGVPFYPVMPPDQYPYQGGHYGYQGYQPHPGYNGQPMPYPPPYMPYPGYYGYGPFPYPFPMPPAKPKRDGYLLGMAITSFIGSILVFLTGLVCTLLLLFLYAVPDVGTLRPGQQFGAIVQFTAYSIAGIIGGGFGLYHSIRSLFLKKPSKDFKLPWFWIFLVLYVCVLIAGGILRAAGLAVSNTPLTVFLIALAGIFPALTILALGVRIIHYPRQARWPTSWRRFTMAIVSGGTLAIVAALILELILTLLAARGLGVSGFAIDNPDQPIPQDPRTIIFLLTVVAVIAPLVEEAVKPLAVVAMIGRIRSAGEAFVLGLSCGIGFNLIETSGYIGMGYRDWLSVAIERSSAGLLHGFGAGMVALGWYYLTHPKESKHRFLLAFGCWIYAILQHAIWNGGSVILQILPAPIGPYLANGTISLGLFELPSIMLVYGIETLLMLIFFIFVARKLRGKTPASPAQPAEQPATQTAFDNRVPAKV